MKTTLLKALSFLAIALSINFHLQSKDDSAIDILASRKDQILQHIEKAKTNIEKKVLDNGVTVLFYPFSGNCQVHLEVVVNVGSKDEHEGQYGFAHMIEHMTFKGTDKISETDINHIGEKFDAIHNAYTSHDSTTFFFRTDNKNWELFVAILADLMQNARFNKDHFDSEVKAVISELNLRRGSDGQKAWAVLQSLLYPLNHPYHHDVIGTREDLVAASNEDLKNFYKFHYTPDNMTVIVVGNLDKNVVFEKVNSYFGRIPKAPAPCSNKTINFDAFLPADFVQHSVTIHTRTTNPITYLAWDIPGEKDKTCPIAEFLAAILSDRLKKIADNLDLAYAVFPFAQHHDLAGVFEIGISPKTEESCKKLLPVSTIDQAIVLIQGEISDLAHNGPTTEEIAKQKIASLKNTLDSFEDIEYFVAILKDYTINNNIYESFDRLAYFINITADDIKNFCKKYITKNKTQRLNCVPLAETEKSDWLALQNNIDVYEKKLLSGKNRESKLENETLLQTLPTPQPLDLIFEKPDLQATLSNGIEVYIKQRTLAPQCTLMIRMKNAPWLSLYFNKNNKGYAFSFASSLAGEGATGTPEHPSNFTKKEISDFFKNYGASASIGAGYFSCMPQDFATIAKQFWHFFLSPTFPQDAVTQHIQNSLEHLNNAKEDPGYIARQTISAHFFKDYPWVKNREQDIAELKALTRQDLVDMYKQLAPSNLFIIFVGDMQPQDTLAAMENIFGTFKKEKSQILSEAMKTTIPDITNPLAIDSALSTPSEQTLLRACRLITTRGTIDERALSLAEEYINRKIFDIRQQTGIFYHCSVDFSSSSYLTKDIATITTRISPANLDKAKEAIKAVLKKLCDEGIDDDYLTYAKLKYASGITKNLTTSVALLNSYSSLITTNRPFSYPEEEYERIKSLTKEQINGIIKQYCNPADWSFITVGRVNNNAA